MKISLNGVVGQWHGLIHRDLAKVAAVFVVTVVAGVAAAVAVAITVALAISFALEIEAQQFYSGVLQLHGQAITVDQPHVQ